LRFLNSDLAVALGGSPHFRRRVMPGQRSQLVDNGIWPDSGDYRLHRRSIERISGDRFST